MRWWITGVRQQGGEGRNEGGRERKRKRKVLGYVGGKTRGKGMTAVKNI